MAAKTKTFKAALHRWPNGSYGLVVTDTDANDGLEPLAVWEVQSSAQGRVATAIIASLLGADTTHTVMRVR